MLSTLFPHYSSQLQGSFKVKTERLLPFYGAALHLIHRMDECSLTHVPRELNKRADALAAMAVEVQLEASEW